MSTTPSRATKLHRLGAQAADKDPKSDEVQKQILNAAAKAFMEKGFASTSVDDIADIMQATKGLIYYYFKSKADLYFAIHVEAMDVSLNSIRPIAQGAEPPIERLKKMVVTHAEVLMANFAVQKVCLEGVKLHMSGSTTLAQRQTLATLIDLRDQFEKLYVNVIRQGIEVGEIREMDTKLVVKLILGSMNWMTIWFRPELSRGKKWNEHIAQEAMRFVLGAVQCPGAAKIRSRKR